MGRPVRSASSRPIAVFPAAVGPQITPTTSASSETTLKLLPGELDDRGPAMHIVRRQRRVAERDEQGAHFAGGQRLSGLDRRLAGNRRGETLVAARRRRRAIAGQRGQRVSK